MSKELEKRAVKVQTEWSYSTPIGRLVPDLRLLNGAEYVVETKLGAETKLLEAMVKLKDSVDNWFVHIASFDPKISKAWVAFRSHSLKKLLTFRDYVKREKLDIIRGVETKGSFGFPFYETFIVSDSGRALKLYDQWFVEKIEDKQILAKNRFTNETLGIGGTMRVQLMTQLLIRQVE